MEILNENISDLFSGNSKTRSFQIKEDSSKGVFVEGLEEKVNIIDS